MSRTFDCIWYIFNNSRGWSNFEWDLDIYEVLNDGLLRKDIIDDMYDDG